MDLSDSSGGTPDYGSPAFFHILRNMRQEPAEIPQEMIWHDNQEGELMDWFYNLPRNVERSYDSGFDSWSSTHDSLSPDLLQAWNPVEIIPISSPPPEVHQHDLDSAPDMSPSPPQPLQQHQHLASPPPPQHQQDDLALSPDMFFTPPQYQQHQDDWGNDENDEMLQRCMDQFERWGDDYEHFNHLVLSSENIHIRKYL